MFKKKDIQIKLTNRWLYTFITIGILAILGAGVYAYNSGGLNLNNNKITNLATPTSNADTTTKEYVDALGGSTYLNGYMDTTRNCDSGWTEIDDGANCDFDILEGEIFCCEPGSMICYARQGANIKSSVTADTINPSPFCISGRDWALCCK